MAAGASLGFSTVERDVSASVNNSGDNTLDIKAKDFNVEAISRQGLSDFMLSAAVAVNESFALETGDNVSRNKNTSTTATTINNVNVNFDGNANVNAEHSVDINVLNTAAGLAFGGEGGAGALNVGIAVNKDQATVNNAITNAKLLGNKSSSNANISTVNASRINNDLYSIGAALALISAGVAGDISVNSMETTTLNSIDDSTVQANNINVKTADSIDLEVDGGAGAVGSLTGVGAVVNVNTINNTTNANITGSTLDAGGALTVDTKETRNFDSTLVAAGLGGVGLAVNVMTTSVNSDIGDIDSAYTRKTINEQFDKANEDLIDTDQIHGMSTSAKAALTDKINDAKISNAAVKKEGVLTNVAGSTLKAGGALKINSTELNDADVTNGSGSLGSVGVAVGDNILHINHKTNTLLTTSDISGGTVDIGATQSQSGDGLNTEVYEVGVGVLEVGVGYNSVQLKGETKVNVKGSNISATNGAMNITALDDAKTDVTNFGANFGVVGVPVTTGKSVNESATLIVIENSAKSGSINSDLSATKALNVKARSANEAKLEVASASGGGLTVASTMSTVRDNNKASVLVNDGNNRFEGTSVNLTAESDPKLKSYAPASSVQIVGTTYVQAETELKGGAEVAVGGGNRFDANSVNYKAQTGSTNRTAAYSEIYSVNGGGISLDTAPNTAKVITETATSVKVGNQTYNDNTAITVDSISQPIRHAYANGYTIGIALASGRDKADIDATDTVTAEIGPDTSLENKAKSLTVNATNKNLTDLKATGGGGAVLDIASQTFTENDSKIDVTAKVGGTWNLSGALKINATSDDTVRGYARQGHGGLAGGAGVWADNTISGTTKATVVDNASITAGSIEMNTLNKFKTDGYKGEESFLLADYYGGGINIDLVASEVTVDKKAYTDVGAGASITTTGAQTYIAKSDGDVMNKVNAAGGGLIVGLNAHADTDVTTDNQVRFAADSKATATGESDFIVKATDLLNIDSLSSGTNGGVLASLVNITENDIDRKNYIDVKGALSTAGNFDFEAGGSKDAFFDDKARQIYIKTVTESNNYTLLQLNDPTANYDLTESNSINIDGSVIGGHDVNMRADGGKVEVIYSSRTGQYSNLEHYTGEGIPDLSGESDSVEKGTYATNLLGTGAADDQSGKEADGVNTNYITVNGNVQAGNSVKDVAIKISGRAIPDNYYIRGTTNSGTIKVDSDIDVNHTVGTFDYADQLAKRAAALTELIRQYTTGATSDEDNTAAVAGFQAELERVNEKRYELGLAIEEGNNTSFASEGLTIVYVELGDISLAGGNVNLNTAAVKGSGKLTAKGAPNIDITNTSNAYLRVNDIRLGGESGNVNLKGRPVLAGDSGLASTLTLDTAMLSGAGNVVIYNNPDKSRVNLTDKTDTSLTGWYDPHPDLRLLGTIDNVNGDVRITNTRGDIDIAAEYKGESETATADTINSANILGKNIYIEAQGTINQGYVEGMVNVGGNPEYVLRADATSALNKAHDELNKAKDKDTKSYTVKESGVNGGDIHNGRIAGNNIYLAAMDININGVLQAGYETYRTSVSDSDIDGLKAEIAANNTDALDKRMKDAHGRYAVNDAGAKYDEAKGYYDYEIPVYYDTLENKLVMEDIETGGGKVYLSGRIASTGSGKIFAANGYATIDIENKTDLPLEVGRVINNDRQAKITIVDTAANVRTDYTPSKTYTIKNYSQMLKEHIDDGALYSTQTEEDNNLDKFNPDTGTYYTTTYQPVSGLRYNWTQGETTMTEKIYHHEEDGWGVLFTDYLFGWVIEGEARDKVESWEKDTTPRTTGGKRSALDTGGFLTDGGSTNDAMNLKAESVLTDTRGPILIAKDTKVKSYLFVNKYTFTMDWKYIYGSQQSYTFDINASKPITVGFLGRERGPIHINSNGSLYLNGDIEMSDGVSNFTLTSNKGGIRQAGDTILRTGKATIHAVDNISGINLETIGRKQTDGTYDDTLELNVLSSNGGDIDINVIGGTTDGHAMPGDVFIGNEGIRSTAPNVAERGNVSLTATGQITGLNGATGKTIVITSENAGVGSNNSKKSSQPNTAAMRLDATNAVEVNAKKNIYIGTPYDGTLNIGKLNSDEGEIYITRYGLQAKVQQAPSYQTGVEFADDETLIRQWIDEGTIAPTEDYEGTYVSGLKARVTEYEEKVNEEYARYESKKDNYEALKATTEADFAEYQALKGDYDTIEDGYYAYVDEVDVAFEDYLDVTYSLRNSLETDYKKMLLLRTKKKLTTTQQGDLKELEERFGDYDSWESYYIANAKTVLNDLMASGEMDSSYLQYVGYNDIWSYVEQKTRPGQLMAQFTKSYDEETDETQYYASADEFLRDKTDSYALMQKYGGYADVAAYLASDEQYKALVEARDNPKFKSTLDEMLAQAEIERAAATLDVTAKHYYIDNARIK